MTHHPHHAHHHHVKYHPPQFPAVRFLSPTSANSMTPAPSTNFSQPHVPPSALALLRRLPDTLSAPLQLAARRRLMRDWVPAHAYLRATTLVVTVRLHPSFTLAMDVHHVHFVTSPSSRRPTVVVRSGTSNISARLRLTHRPADWVRALTAVATVPVPRLSHFSVICPIGKGGGGEVYVVRDARDPRSTPLAMKVVQKHAAFASPATLRRALDERLALELVRGFPFIVRLTHAFQTNTALYMATTYCPGGDLRGLLRRTRAGRLSEATAKPLLAQIILALEHVHSLHILFRDLKPENVLLSANGDVRLCDFGLCKILPPSRPVRARSFCGSTMYMSPQIVSAKPYGFATDLWSLGALFFRVLVGRAPFEQPPGLIGARNDAPDVHGRIISDTPTIPTFVSPEARQLLLGLLRKHEEERMSLPQVKNCAFFSDVDWHDVLDQGYKRTSGNKLEVTSPSTSYSASTCTTVGMGGIGGARRSSSGWYTGSTGTTNNNVDMLKNASVVTDAQLNSRLDENEEHGRTDTAKAGATVLDTKANHELVEGLSNFDSERLISHGVKLEDDEMMGCRRSGRVISRRSKSMDRDRQPRVVKSASVVASSFTSLFLRDTARDAANAARTVVGFNFCMAEGRPLYKQQTVDEDDE